MSNLVEILQSFYELKAMQNKCGCYGSLEHLYCYLPVDVRSVISFIDDNFVQKNTFIEVDD